MIDWLGENPGLVTALTVLSVSGFLAGLALGPWLAASIPADYFTHERRPPPSFAGAHPVLRALLRVAKNALGGLLLLAGVAMLVLPGQGLLTMFVGLLLLDVPGKFRLERWLVARPWVRRPINWLRRRRGRPPLDQPLVPPAPPARPRRTIRR